MDAGVSCSVAVVVDCSKSKSVQEGPIRGDVGEGWAGRGLESPKTPFSFVVVGDASYCRGGSVIQLILHHGGDGPHRFRRRRVSQGVGRSPREWPDSVGEESGYESRS